VLRIHEMVTAEQKGFEGEGTRNGRNRGIGRTKGGGERKRRKKRTNLMAQARKRKKGQDKRRI